jgi:imidazolonepropionase-like amidohydrolase
MIRLARTGFLLLLGGGTGGALLAVAPPSPESARTSEPSVAGVQAFVGARVLDGTGAAPIEDGVVVVRDGIISAVGARGQLEIPADAEVVELGGRWLVPGFINAHGHVGGSRASMEAQLEQYAHYGVTTVLSLGGDEAEGFPLRDAQWTPELRRSRVLLAGPVLSPDTPAEAVSEVARVAEMGADWVKIRVDGGLGGGSKMSPEVYGAVIRAAEERGLRVAIHIWELEDAKGVVAAGGALVAHSVRDGPVDGELAALMLDRDVCLVPTLTRELSTFVYASRPPFFDDPFFRERAAPEDLDGFLTPQRRAQAEGSAGQFWREALPVAQENMGRLHEAGVGVAMGTDTGPVGRFQGYFEHVEMEMMVEGGLTPPEVLVAATGRAADCLGLEASVGTIQAGRWGDLVALNADPRVDIRNTRAIHGVWIAGNQVR